MLIDVYMMLIGTSVLLAFYSFLIKDNEYYTNMITSMLSGLMFMLLGLSSFEGLTTQTNDIINFNPSLVGGFFTVFGIIMILYTLLLINHLMKNIKLSTTYKGKG